jgi:hypothetical protein
MNKHSFKTLRDNKTKVTAISDLFLCQHLKIPEPFEAVISEIEYNLNEIIGLHFTVTEEPTTNRQLKEGSHVFIPLNKLSIIY